ncbi:MAG: DUF433 domain-containing protein [Candidatus Anammoximicrobium sp.]|nr:DUF433 domain-containing protein [Candidatus Anammoximicrobium sp.]
MITAAYPHIESAAEGVPIIAGTKTKVVEVVLDRLAHHWDADEIQRQHPHLTLAQIYAALAYYHDHQDEIDREIDERLEHVDRVAASQPPSIVRARLKMLGKLP